MTNQQHSRRISLVKLTREALAISAARRTATAIVMLIAAVGAFIPLAVSAQAQNARSDALAALDRPEQRIVKITDSEFVQRSTTLDPATVSQLRELSIVDNLIRTRNSPRHQTPPKVGRPVSGSQRSMSCQSAGSGRPVCSVRLPQTHTGSARTLHLALEPAFIAVAGRRRTETHPFADPGIATRNICDWTAARQLLILVDEPASVQKLIDLILPSVASTSKPQCRMISTRFVETSPPDSVTPPDNSGISRCSAQNPGRSDHLCDQHDPDPATWHDDELSVLPAQISPSSSSPKSRCRSRPDFSSLSPLSPLALQAWTIPLTGR